MASGYTTKPIAIPQITKHETDSEEKTRLAKMTTVYGA